MALNQNKGIRKNIVEGLKLQELSDEIPQKVASSIVPVFVVNEKDRIDFVITSSSTTTGTLIINIPNNDKDYFISNIQATYIKDVVCDTATGVMNVQLTLKATGITVAIYKFPVITLTVQDGNIAMEFPVPILVKGGSAVQLTGTFTAGVMVRTLAVTGFTRDKIIQ